MTTTTGRSTKGRSTKSATVEPPADKSSPEPHETGDVARAVERDLALMPTALATGGLAITALALAREIDAPTNSATSKSMCARSLLETMDRLRALTPVDQEADGLDDLARRREARRAGGSGTKD